MYLPYRLNNKEVKNYINFLEVMISKDYTSENEFNMEIEKFLSNKIKFRKVNALCSEIFGSSNSNGKIITIENLMSDKVIEYSSNTKCIVIPKKELMKRRQYGWFLKLSQREIIESNFALATLLIMLLRLIVEASIDDSLSAISATFTNFLTSIICLY